MRYSTIALGAGWAAFVAVIAAGNPWTSGPLLWSIVLAANCCGIPFMHRLGKGEL